MPFLDIDFFQDQRIELLSAKFGLKGEAIAIRVLCAISKNGYYEKWDEDKSLLLAKRAGDRCTDVFVNDIIKELTFRGVLDVDIYQNYGILTSKEIQAKYVQSNKRRKSIEIIECIALLEGIKAKNINYVNDESILPKPAEKPNTEIAKIEYKQEVEVETGDSVPMVKGRKKRSKPESKTKEPDFIDEIVKIFGEKYYQNRGVEYYISNMGKERSAAATILGFYKKKHPDEEKDNTLYSLSEYFNLCINQTLDNWIHKNMSLSLIVLKFNELNNILKNGQKYNRVGKQSATSDEELAAILFKHYGNEAEQSSN